VIFLETKEIKTTNDRIKKEQNRLKKLYKDIEPKRKALAQPLIERAAFMLIQAQDLEMDLSENGFFEQFSQGNQEPYERERPAARVYNQLNGGYQKIMKQLTDLLPKEGPPPPEDDGFDDFVTRKDAS